MAVLQVTNVNLFNWMVTRISTSLPKSLSSFVVISFDANCFDLWAKILELRSITWSQTFISTSWLLDWKIWKIWRSQINSLLGDRFPRKNSRWHDGIYNIYWLPTRFRFVRLLTQLFPSNLEVHFTSAIFLHKFLQFVYLLPFLGVVLYEKT